MALSDVDIANLALSALGVEDGIANFTENSTEAAACARWYEPVRDLVFQTAPWDSLTGTARLAVLATRDDDEDWVTTDPQPGWSYAFSVPSDMIRPRYLASYEKFILSTRGNARAIMAQSETPILIYTKKQTRVDLWDIGLQHAVAYALAAHIAKAVTGKDADLQNMFALANDKIASARATFQNSSQDQPMETVPDWLAVRGYGGNAPLTRYIYPPQQFQMIGMGNLG